MNGSISPTFDATVKLCAVSREPNFQPPRKLRFDWTITAGNLLTLLMGVLALCGAYVDYRLTSDRHEIRLTNIEANVAALFQHSSDESKQRVDMTRALDKLTSTIEARDKYHAN